MTSTENKLDVGVRMARWALAEVYGRKRRAPDLCFAWRRFRLEDRYHI